MTRVKNPRIIRRLACRESRAHPEKYGKPTIIALTASATDGARQRCLAMGMDNFLRKPMICWLCFPAA